MMLRILAIAGGVAAFMAVPTGVMAHGLGGRADLPVPVEFFLVAGGIALVVSFVLLALLWPDARWQEPAPTRPVAAATTLRRTGLVLQVVGIVVFLAAVAGGLFGNDNASRNILPVIVWVGFWLVVPFLSAVVGNWYAYLNPWRTGGGLLGIGRTEKPEYLERFGVYPATAAFIAFTWLELVYSHSSQPRDLAIAALVYTGLMFAVMGAAGLRTGLAVGDGFTAYNGFISRISPLGRDGDGRLVWRGWLRALPAMSVWRGSALFVAAMIGTVTYDGISATRWWRDRWGLRVNDEWFGTLAILATVGVIAAAYYGACWAAGRLAGSERTPGAIADSFAHTLVPIALAYAFAHYFTLVLFEGQQALALMSDPFGQGWDLFGTADWEINFTWLSPNVVWYTQVTAIVGGHIAGVVLAHDRAIADFGKEDAVRSQYAMLGLMVGLTILGLTLLATS